MKMLKHSFPVAAIAGACVVALALGGCNGSKETSVTDNHQSVESTSAEVTESPAQTPAQAAATDVVETAEKAAGEIEGGVANAEDVVAETAEAAQEAGKELLGQTEEQANKVVESVAGTNDGASTVEESHN